MGWREERDPTDSRCQGKVGADIMDRVTMEGILTAGREQGTAVNLSIIPFDKKNPFQKTKNSEWIHLYINLCQVYNVLLQLLIKSTLLSLQLCNDIVVCRFW